MSVKKASPVVFLTCYYFFFYVLNRGKAGKVSISFIVRTKNYSFKIKCTKQIPILINCNFQFDGSISI